MAGIQHAEGCQGLAAGIGGARARVTALEISRCRPPKWAYCGTMGDMYLTPVAGTNREHFQMRPQEQPNAIVRLRNSGVSGAQARLVEYLEWAANALQHPGMQISPADLTGPC